MTSAAAVNGNKAKQLPPSTFNNAGLATWLYALFVLRKAVLVATLLISVVHRSLLVTHLVDFLFAAQLLPEPLHST